MYLRLSRHIFLHIGLLFLAVLSFFSPAGAQFRLVFFFAALHEVCHYLAARILKAPVLSLALLPYGCHLRLGKTELRTETKIVLAGPLGSLLLSLLFRGSDIGRINGMLFLINLLPALPLDGGRLLRLYLWRTCGTFQGNRTMRRMAFWVSASLFFMAAYLPAPFLFCISALPLLSVRSIPMCSPLLQKKAAGTQSVKTFSARPRDSLLSLSHAFSPFYYAQFRVRDTDYILSEETVSSALRQNAAARVSDILESKRGYRK